MNEAEDLNVSSKPSKHRRRRRGHKNAADVNEVNEVKQEPRMTESQIDDYSNKEQRKRRRSRKPKKIIETEIAECPKKDDSIEQHVAQLQSDIINNDERPESSPSSIWHTDASTYSHGKLFIEFQHGVFKAIEKNKLEKLEMKDSINTNQNLSKEDPVLQAVSMGLWLHNSMQKLANCIQGIFAGFALCYLIIVYSLGSSAFTTGDWLKHYSALTLPVEASFYILSVICLWTLLGRCGIGGDDFNVWEQMKQYNSALLAIVMYFLTLILTLSMANVSSQHNIMHLKTEKVFTEEIVWWRNVNLCRCLATILGWLILSTATYQDCNGKFLEELKEKYYFNPHLKTESA